MMKKKTVRYTIEEPCRENWDAMSPLAEGRFCNSCAKSVVDFTTMSDHQIVSYISAAKASVCVRMTTDQIDRDLAVHQQAQVRLFNLQALVLGTALSAFTALNVYAQGPVKQGTTLISPTNATVIMGEPAITPRKLLTDAVLSGTVVHHTRKVPLTAVEVTSYDEAGNRLSSAFTNDDGIFELSLHVAEHPYRVVFRKPDYEEAAYVLEELLTMGNVTVALVRAPTIMIGKPIRCE